MNTIDSKHLVMAGVPGLACLFHSALPGLRRAISLYAHWREDRSARDQRRDRMAVDGRAVKRATIPPGILVKKIDMAGRAGIHVVLVERGGRLLQATKVVMSR
jgi:hypothetical protein